MGYKRQSGTLHMNMESGLVWRQFVLRAPEVTILRPAGCQLGCRLRGQTSGWRCFTFHFLIPLLKVFQFNKVPLSHSLMTTSVEDTNQVNKGQ